MNTIQKKIWMLAGVVIVMMFAIWLMLTFYNQKMQDQYNDILQRYLQMHEVSDASQQTVTNLNDYLTEPTERTANRLERSQERLLDAQASMLELRNAENEFTLTNYSNMIESFNETVDRSVAFSEQAENETALTEFTEANRISIYISEMTLSIFNSELKTYERFYRDIIRQSEDLDTMGVLLLSLTSILLLLFTYLFSLSITKPVHQLTKAANELANGRFDQPIRVDSNDEISFLAKTFDHMRININKLILEIQQKAQVESELQESKLLLQQSQMRHLQSQINPHFLFNTLNTLSKKAYLDGAEETSDLLVSVAGLLRYNLKRMDHTVTVQEEAYVLKQYMEIQKARFSDRLNFHIELDESALLYQMPSLTLQPLIENAVIHGIEPKEEDGRIWFRIKDVEGNVFIEIEDNGKGMDDAKKKALLEGSISPQEGHSTGIGFANVVKRLQLFYGREDVVIIESTPGRGTKIILKLPKVMEVENYV
ncbi:sensor histidine kinase [Planococcus halotolerans]|uniref:histidine kinase n=1 Tax=Planococcus halotolerans TaxID=2233542 RepID=A0A365KX94_9BACL|nr:sensor histidine kinase [Planococcus halotolerans]QHJ69185.1 HAMP domain-containing protein [Planococcus halotolerans]RAZ77613.1 two-component sensor histidine kinase [Planococcus halotolerans]